ncbi:PIG-L family deacetylase [Occultella glacieicola]|uniref:PIG-L family deacetylase n=1 Tax=Occultella glacieicola TaxID=2518684 RepID=A0ABY2DY25_9MICO|nr:PIG-L family deacetylase [Occultella glacieicola]TDE89190.1 PIG-L family deacetylase [Occultella glacieicola]
MSPQTIMAVGGHIGDMDLAAGPLLAQNVLDGGRSVLVALTPGERGHPRMSADDYRDQKIAEAQAFAAGIGAEVVVFDDISDGFLTTDDLVAERLADLIREVRPATLLAHWRRSIHTDHENASILAERARFLAGLPGWKDETERHGVGRLLFTENWEDATGFDADLFIEISAEAHRRWTEAIGGQAFARGETYGFRYIDFYTAQMVTRGCLAGVPHAVALSSGPTRGMSPLD